MALDLNNQLPYLDSGVSVRRVTKIIRFCPHADYTVNGYLSVLRPFRPWAEGDHCNRLFCCTCSLRWTENGSLSGRCDACYWQYQKFDTSIRCLLGRQAFYTVFIIACLISNYMDMSTGPPKSRFRLTLLNDINLLFCKCLCHILFSPTIPLYLRNIY